jgi:hypothetical protein
VKRLANQGVLPVEPEEEFLLKTPISEHEKLPLSEGQWQILRMRVKRVLSEYLQAAH